MSPQAPPRFLLAHPGTATFVQEIALALHEGDMLERFATTVVDDPKAGWRRAAGRLPLLGKRIDQELRRRRVPPWLLERSVTFPAPELVRVLASRLDGGGMVSHRVWEHTEPAFDRWTAYKQLDGVDAVYGFEGSALHLFREAKRRGLFAVMDLPARAQEQVARIFERELSRWPELASSYTRNLAKQRPQRARLVRQQIELASCVIANSQLTLQSYIETGHAMHHAVAVPLAAPRAIDPSELRAHAAGPLRLLFAGTLSVHKGGHYLLEAFKREPSMYEAELTICGRVTLPDAFMRERRRGVTLRGHLGSGELQRAYLEHDALVLPTLSDGFGLVVTEALAHGLPVITTDQCGAAELIVDGHNGLITRAADLESLMAALAYCAKERDALHAMRAAALATAERRPWSRYRAELGAVLAERYSASMASATSPLRGTRA